MEWYHISFELRPLTAQLLIPREIDHWTWKIRGLITERGLAGTEGKAFCVPQFAHGLLWRSQRQSASAMSRPSYIYICTWIRTCTHGFNMTVRRGQSYIRDYSNKTVTNIPIISTILWGEKYSFLKKYKSRVLLAIQLALNVSNFTMYSPCFQDGAKLYWAQH